MCLPGGPPELDLRVWTRRPLGRYLADGSGCGLYAIVVLNGFCRKLGRSILVHGISELDSEQCMLLGNRHREPYSANLPKSVSTQPCSSATVR